LVPKECGIVLKRADEVWLDKGNNVGSDKMMRIDSPNLTSFEDVDDTWCWPGGEAEDINTIPVRSEHMVKITAVRLSKRCLPIKG
jgi:hypothetical protein